MARLKVRLVEAWVAITRGFTPQTSCSWRATFTSLVIARMGVEGRNLLTVRPVAPLLVSVKIAAASSWVAIVLTAMLIAFGIVQVSWVSGWRFG